MPIMENNKKKTTKNIIYPKSSLANKTGAWRNEKPVTDYSKCIGCSRCAKVCPESCIVMKKTKAGLKPEIDLDYCKGCALCAEECPVKAILMEKEY